MKKVFLGGTCNESLWRETIIEVLEIDYFNPIVDDWTPDCMTEERRQRKECDFCLYVITPKMTGVYAIAELIDDSNKRPEKTVCVFMMVDGDKTFTESQRKSLFEVGKMVSRNGGAVHNTLLNAAKYMNVRSTI